MKTLNYGILPLKMEHFTLEFRVFQHFFYDIFDDKILWCVGERKVCVCFYLSARAFSTRNDG